MSGSVQAGNPDAPVGAPTPTTGTDWAVSNSPPSVNAQGVVTRIDAYGLYPQPVAPHTAQRTPLRLSGLVTLALTLAWLAWLAYFVVVVAIRVHVWPL